MKRKHVLALILTLALLSALALPAAASGLGDNPGGIIFPLPTIPPIIDEEQVVLNSSNFPDSNFRSYLIKAYGEPVGLVSYAANVSQVTSIDCAGLSIQSLAGIELFPFLEYLDCSDNLLSSLDVSANTALTALYTAGNPSLSTLDVSEIPALCDALENGESWEEDGVLGFESEQGQLCIDVTTALAGWHFIFFDTNGGDDSEFPFMLVKDGEAAVCPDHEPENRDNWFLGWYRDGVEYDWDSPVTQNIYLVAEWGEPCTVTLDCAGGTIDGESEVTLDFCTRMTLRGELPTPVFAGKHFCGWTLDGEPYDLDAPLEGDITLTASWVDAWTLHFDRGSEHDDGAREIPDITMPAGSADSLDFYYEYFGTQATVLHDDGNWQFVGWDYAPDAAPAEAAFPRYANGAEAPLSGPNTVEMAGDVTLYAIYGEAPTITVMKNDGSGEAATGVVQKSGVYSYLLIGSNLRREGYDLLGFSTNPEAAEPDEGLARLSLGKCNYVYYYAEEDVTLYAVWGDRHYALSFNLNGGEGELPETLYYTMSDKPEITLPESGAVSKAHRTLLGWAVILTSNYNAHMTDVDYGKMPIDTVCAPGSVLPAESLKAYDLTVYAVWQYEPIVVSLDPTGLEDYANAVNYPMYYNYGADASANASGAPTGHPATPNTQPAAKPFPDGIEPGEDEELNAFAAWLDQDGRAYPTRTISTVNNKKALLPNDRDTELLAVWKHTFVCYYEEDGELIDFEAFRYDAEEPALSHSVTLPDAPEYEGCVFLGWTDTWHGQPTLQPGDELEVRGDLMLWAVRFIPDAPDCVTPEELTVLEDGALAGTDFRYVMLNEGLTTLGSRVFADCGALLAVYVPASVTEIASDAFDGASETLLLIGEADSPVAAYAKAHDMDFLDVEAVYG